MSTPEDFSVPSSPSSTTSDDDDYTNGVGLADRALSQTRRKLLDLMNRMSNTGSDILAAQCSQYAYHIFQGTERYRPASDRRHRPAERRKVVAYRIYIRNHPA